MNEESQQSKHIIRRRAVKIAVILIVLAVVAVNASFFYLLKESKGLKTIGADGELVGVELMLEQRRLARTDLTVSAEFFSQNTLSILVIGVDSRVGVTEGHCDAIQFIEIDKQSKEVRITAVPRGTYSPLPPGKGTTSSDYYVSNACGLGGLEYGIDQIERILGKQADHVAVIGFSGTMGVLRTLKLPTTETLQWLRHRQGYAIGEPQRARNHSTFLKQQLIERVPSESSSIDTPLHYLLYSIVQTDLTFAEVEKVIDVLIGFDLKAHPERVVLDMKPSYVVQDIPYDAEHVGEYVESMVSPIAHLLKKDDYQQFTKEEIDANVLAFIDTHKEDPHFLEWAYANKIWLQIDNEEKRDALEYDMISRYVDSLDDVVQERSILEEYILEMEYLEKDEYLEKGKALLTHLYE